MKRDYNALSMSRYAILKNKTLNFSLFLIQTALKNSNASFNFKLFFVMLFAICFNSNAQVSALLNPTYGYTFSNINGSYNPLTTGTVFQSGVSLNTDIVSGAITLPSAFAFNGIKENTIFISNNGFITFGKAQLTATTKYIISTTVTSGYDGVISGFANDLVAAASGSPEIRYGTNASNDFVIQYQDLAINLKTATRVTFQIVLKADGKTVQIVYGPNNTGQSGALASQVGLRGTSPFDYNNRSLAAGGNWNTTGGSVGSTSASTMSWVDTSILPTSGRTMQWVPTTYAPTYLATPFTTTQDFTTFINGSGPSNVPSANWATNGYGNASWQIDNVTASPTTSGWDSTTGAYSPVDFQSAVGGHSARFHSNATAPQVGYLDYYVNLSAGTGVLTVDFYQINTSGTDILQVFLSTNGGASFTQVGTDLGIATTWTYRVISLGATTSPNAIIRFKGISDFGSSDIGIDNVKVSQPLACLTPTAVTTSNIAGNAATIAWTCVGCTGTFDVEYGAYGHVAGTGTIISNVTSPYTLNPPLNSNSVYTVYVRQKCNGTPGLWSDPTDFTTLYACPANLGAGLVNVPALPYTYTNQTTLGSGDNVTTSNPYCIAGSPSYYGGEDKTYIFTPVVSGTHTITLTTSGVDRAGIMLYQGCPFTPGSSCVGFTQSISGSTRVLTRSLTSGVTYYLVVDNFPTPNYISNYSLNIDSPATCGVPTGLAVSNVTDSKADLAWVAPATVGTAGSYNWEIRSSGAGGSGTTGLATSGQTTAPTVSVVNASGLLPKTAYNLYVKTNCTGTAGPSLWAGPFSFITALDCNLAIPISAGTSVTTGNLATTNSVYNLSACGFSSAGGEALYTFTSTAAGTYSFNITSLNGGSGFIDSFFKVASLGCGSTGWNCIDDNGSVGTDSFTLAASTTYFILLDSEATTGIANHTFNITAPTTTQTCATVGTVTNTTAVTCFGGNNGSATITLSASVPSNNAITYTVNGGASTSGTLTAGVFTISGLTVGSHSVVITNTGCSNITVPVTITGPTSALTNSTTITSCANYYWSVTGQTYTTGGTYTGTSTNGSGCTVNQTLVLTITPATTTGSVTTSICSGGTYTWPANGVTYTTAQSGLTFVSGCNTATLNLSITPATTTGSVTTSICTGGSYTWPANGVTYTTAQSNIKVITGCNTATLNLTIAPATTTGSVTTSICAGGSYTWPANGVTYTTAQSGVTVVSGCNTATLNLSITPATTTGSITTSICAGGSYTWPANGVTYTTAQSNVKVITGCNTATLNLTITPATTTGSVTTSICSGGSYTWPANGVTYTTAQSGLTFVSGCNTATLNLTITPATTTGSVTTSICAGGSFTWPANGVTYTTAQSNVKVITGCNTATLNLTIAPATTTGSVTTSICSGGSYTWPANGVTYTTAQSGLTFVSGCNTATLNLTIAPATTTGSVTTSICAGGSYTWPANGVTYTTAQSGVTFVSGCNTATLNLSITPPTTTGSVTTSICAGSSYTWPANGVTYTTAQSGVTLVSGCNTATLNLTVNSPTTGTTNASACNSYTWALPLGNGLTYTSSVSGVTKVSTNAAGCAHTQTLNLTISNNTSHTTVATACTSYTWALPLGNGQTYTSSVSGITNITVNGSCTHTETLNLTITPPTTTGSVTTSICSGGSYTWPANGVTYTTVQSGLTFVSGCNTATLNLSITPATTTGSVTTSICSGGSYTWPANGVTYTTAQSGLTFISGCNTATLNLTITPPTTTGSVTTSICSGSSYTWPANGVTYTTAQSGVTVVSGCNTATLNLSVNSPTTGTTNASACNSYTWALPLGNGLTYTSSVSGVTKVSTNAAGCTHTQTLNLTISNNTSHTTVATACTSYIWALPLGNGQTYTSSVSGVNNVTTNGSCTHTETLNLTITPHTTTGSVTTSICPGGSYTWPVNGVTYTTAQSGVTVVSGCNTATLNLSITPATTTGSVTTSICPGGSYTWPANGITYTTAQSGVTVVSGCNTATLNLSITPTTTNGSVTTSICPGGSYTWPANGVTYTTAQSGLTFVSGCNTATLNLSITPTTTTGSVTTSICPGGSYTWPANGVTYTTAQSGLTFVSGCNTATLNLSITPPTTTGSVTTSICFGSSYTWPANGVTYTTAQSGVTVVSGCNTATLNLTVNSPTAGTTTTSACTSYTWPLPLGNGLTYTSSVSGVTKVSTNAAGCTHTQTLNLTINSTTTNGSLTTTANNTYTWPANGQTYTTSGVYTYNSVNTAGCLNVATLNLTIVSATQTTYYQDLDGDSYGNSAVTLLATGQPLGYVTNNTDCNDTVAAINPLAVEILYDGIDNNCNGQLDEGSQLTTTVLHSQCGTTLGAIGSLIEVTPLSSSYTITGYRFRITNGTTVQTLDSTLPNFNLTMLTTYNYSTTYSIEVQLQRNGIWLGYYGNACSITTPSSAVSNTSSALIASQCGITLATITTSITTPTKSGAKGYKFRVINLRTGFVQEVIKNKNWFALTDLSQYTYGDTYTVEVSVKTGSVYPAYGNVCTVTAPAVPSLTNQCGLIIPSKTTSINTTTLNKVTSYNFEVTNMTTLVTVSVTRTSSSFTLSLLSNYRESTQFQVRLRVMTSNVYSDYGPACFITSPALARLSGSPNPFDNNFKLDFASSSTGDVTVSVFDLLGKLLEERTFEYEDTGNQEIGERLPTGIYIVNVSQGEDVKTLKMIKK